MYIARQPIFDKALKVYGYELLFRSDSQSTIFDGNSSMQATASVVGGLYEAQLILWQTIKEYLLILMSNSCNMIF